MAGPTAVLTSPAELAAVAQAWRRLAASVEATSYFHSPDWVLSWYEAFAAGDGARVAVWQDAQGELDAVVPLLHGRERLHRRLPLGLRFLTNLGSGAGAADHCGFPALPAVQQEVRSWLADQAGAGLLLRNLDPGSGASYVPPGAVLLERTQCPRAPIPDDLDKVGSSTSFRKKLRWYSRRVAEAGISFSWVGPGRVTPEMIDVLLGLHDRRSAMAGRSSTFTEARRQLHVGLAARGRPDGGPAMVLGDRGGVVVAALYGFRWRDEFAYYQTGWEPALANLSLGTVLVAEAIRLAGADGARVFDFLRGAEPYKYRFGAEDRCDETWLVPRGPAGRLLQARHAIAERRRPDR